jgi:hypothetical protein
MRLPPAALFLFVPTETVRSAHDGLGINSEIRKDNHMISARADQAVVSEYKGKLANLVMTGYANSGHFFWVLAIACNDQETAANVHQRLKNASPWTNHAEPQKTTVLVYAVTTDRIQADRLYRDAVVAIEAEI